MSRDYYAVLGVSPTSEDVVIRAAYHALMRRYHPDADPSTDASQRAQAINAAYAVLSDPEARARYDGTRAAQGLIKADPPARSGRRRRMLLGPAAFVGIAALAVTGTMIATIPPGDHPQPAPSRSDVPQGTEAFEAGTRPPKTAAAATHSATGSAPAEVPNAMLEPAEEVDLPQPGGSSTSRHDPTPEPALAKAAGTPQAKTSPFQPAATCRLGSRWADRAICSSANLTALDRQHGLLYAQSWDRADAARRVALLDSRERFQGRRNACRSESCLTSAYVARLREISDIMARGVQQ